MSVDGTSSEGDPSVLPRIQLLAMVTLAASAGVGDAQPRFFPQAAGFGPYAPRGRVIILGNSYALPASSFSFGVFERRSIIEVIVPPRLPPVLLPMDDFAGVDLDVTPPPWANVVERAPLPPPAKKLAEQIANAPAKVAPPAAPPPRPKAPDPMEPNGDPVLEGQRLTLLGIAAFRGQEYGLAARRFHQAIDADPAAGRARFLLGQAAFALGKYRDAVQSIGLGLGLEPQWPQSAFRPRFDLYVQHPQDWQRHLALLEDARARQPDNAGYLFLLAHQRWFDDQRDDAVKLFRQARPLVGDPTLVDLFLKAKGP